MSQSDRQLHLRWRRVLNARKCKRSVCISPLPWSSCNTDFATISIGKLTSVEQAVRYLREAIAHQQIEYYTARGELPGCWNGAGAKALGLRGERRSTPTSPRCSAGTHPRTGADLGKHWRTQSVVAFDVAVSAPKDVSILYALGDERMRATILRIHGEGVQAAGDYLQANAGWARQFNPKTKTTEAVLAKLVMPEFVHRTARPVTDPSTGRVTVDPQLHTHVTVPTWVQRPDGSWSQLYSGSPYEHAAAAGAIAQAEWRDRLVRELGISTVVDGKGCFSIVGITDAQRREFSRRTQQIEALERQLGIESPYGHKLAVVSTRESKDEVAPTENLFAQWQERAAGVGLDAATRISAFLAREPAASQPRRLDVERGTELLGERGLTAQYATFTRRDVIRTVAAHAPLGMGRAQLEATADPGSSPTVRRCNRWCRSGSRESAIATRSPDGSTAATSCASPPRRCSPSSGHDRHRSAAIGRVRRCRRRPREVEAAIAARSTLTTDQRVMVQTVCQSPAGVVIVEGAAGVGKTFALDVCREAFEATGIQVVGCALAGRAADVLENGRGHPHLDGHRDAQRAAGGSPAAWRRARGGRGGHDRRPRACQAGLTRGAGQRQAGRGRRPLAAAAHRRRGLHAHSGRAHRQGAGHRERAPEGTLGASGPSAGARRRGPRRLRPVPGHPPISIAELVAERRAEVVAEHARLEDRGVDAVILAQRRDEVAALNELARALGGRA